MVGCICKPSNQEVHLQAENFHKMVLGCRATAQCGISGQERKHLHLKQPRVNTLHIDFVLNIIRGHTVSNQILLEFNKAGFLRRLPVMVGYEELHNATRTV